LDVDDYRMTVDFDFSRDPEFCKLLARRQEVDLTRAALELARDAQPKLDFDHTLSWIHKRAAELQSHILKVRSDREMLRELVRCLAGTHGLHGDKQAFQRAECSYINRVIETGVGIPISLSVVYVAVAQSAGLELTGVAAPMHFLTRFDTVQGPLFVDAFHDGQVLNYDDCLEWITSLSGLTSDEIERSLEPASPREVVIRMLNNLKALHVTQEDWEPAWHVQRRLLALHANTFEHRRDLALIAIKSNRPGVAIDLLETCLKDCSPKDRPLIQSQLQVAEHQMSRWN
jgi:regulator of sirC expression with transglutaminase-like and TPR domain